MSALEKHSLTLQGHRTSVSLEAVFWKHLKRLAKEEGLTLSALVSRVDGGRGANNLSSALRLYVVERLEK